MSFEKRAVSKIVDAVCDRRFNADFASDELFRAGHEGQRAFMLFVLEYFELIAICSDDPRVPSDIRYFVKNNVSIDRNMSDYIRKLNGHGNNIPALSIYRKQ